MKSQTITLSNPRSRIGAVLRKYAPQMILIALVIFFSILSPNFMTPKNIIIIVRQISFVAISAVGLMFVMIGGGIDLSIMMVYGRVPMAVAIPLTLVLGTALGALNGFLSIKLKIHPLIITLGTAAIYKGVGYILAASRNIMGFPDIFRWFGQGYIGPIPVPIIIMVIVALIGNFILVRTYFGRYTFALGGNEEAARLAGVNTNRMKVVLFSICGFISGI